MLPKENRLSKKETNKVFKKGKKIFGDFLVLRIVPNSLNLSRFTVVVPKKNFKKATQRNKIKRLIRESLRKKLLRIKKGFDGIFIATSLTLNKDYQEIEKEVEKLLRFANILE